MEFSVREIADRIGGQVHGDEGRLLSDGQSLSKASPSDLTFVADDKNVRGLTGCRAGAVLIPPRLMTRVVTDFPGMTFISVANPHEAFMTLLQVFRPAAQRVDHGRSEKAWISATAQIGPGCSIYPGVFIGENVVIGANCEIYPGVTILDNCRIGESCLLYPRVTIYQEVVIGNRVIVHAGAVLGADGFGYRFQEGRFVKIPQLGTVHVHDDVEIGACATVDRGMIGPTVIGEGTKLDNLVMIGHNCELGKHNAFASQVGFAGSVTTGDYVRCAGQVGVADHVHLGDGCVLGAKAGVHKDMPGNAVYLGTPATDEHEQFKMLMSMRKLPEMRKHLRELELQIAELTARLAEMAPPSQIRIAA